MSITAQLEYLESNFGSLAELADERLPAVAETIQAIATEMASVSREECTPGELARLDRVADIYRSLGTRLAVPLLTLGTERVAHYAGHISDEERPRAPKDLGEAIRQIDLAEAFGVLGPVDKAKAQEARAQAQLLSGQLVSEGRFAALVKEAEVQKNRAEAILELRPDDTVDISKAILEKLSAAAAEGGWSEEQQNQIARLAGEAKRRYDDVRRRLQMPTTYDTSEKMDPAVIHDFRAIERQYEPGHPNRMVNYWSDSQRQATPRLQDVSRAIEVAQLRVIGFLWNPKVEEYVQAASRKLREHRPHEADVELRKADTLPYRDRVDLGLQFPEHLAKILADKAQEIAPELKKYRDADKILTDAEIALTVKADLIAAEKLRRQAADTYSYHPGVESLRNEIIIAAKRVLPQELSALRKFLEQRSTWHSALARQRIVDGLLEIDRELRFDYAGDAEFLKGLTHRTAELQSRRKVTDSERRADLRSLQGDYPEFWDLPGWQELHTELERLDAGRDLSTLVERASQYCGPDAKLSELGRESLACADFLANPPGGLTSKDIAAVTAVQTRLGAWQAFAQARDELSRAATDQGADLTDVRTYLNRAVAGSEPAMPSAIRPLQSKYEALKAGDAAAEAKLRELQLTAQKADLAVLRMALAECALWAQRVSSHRNSFVLLQDELKVSLQMSIEQSARQLIQTARTKHFEALDIDGLNELLNAARSLDLATPPTWTTHAEVALAVALAWQAEREAVVGRTQWAVVEEMWIQAVKAVPRSDSTSVIGAAHRSHAHKRVVMLSARNSDTKVGVGNTLAPLIAQAEYDTDLDVWRMYADAAAAALREIGESRHDRAATDEMTTWATRARVAATRVRSIVAAEDGNSAQQDSSLLVWEGLIEIRRRIHTALGAPEQRIGAKGCYDAAQKLAEGRKKMAAATPVREALESFWAEQSRVASARAEQQLTDIAAQAMLESASEETIFARLDCLLALAILNPNEILAQARLTNPMSDTENRLRRRINDTCEDASAQRFMQRVRPEMDDGGLDVARLQLEDARKLQAQIDTFVSARRITQAQLKSVEALSFSGEESGTLEQETTKLERWIDELNQLVGTVAIALARAQQGLRQEDALHAASYVLRDTGGVSRPGLPQIAQKFSDQAHPSVLAARDRVEKNRTFRKEQQRRRGELEFCLTFAAIVKLTDLPSIGAVAGDRRAILEQLRNGLSNIVAPVFPLNVAANKIAEFHAHDPEDACGEQARIRYQDESGQFGEIVGLDFIRPVIEDRSKQVSRMSAWLRRFVDAGTSVSDVPGWYSWADLVERLSERRDSGSAGLVEASSICKQLLESDQVLGRWSLRKLEAELDFGRAVSYLRSEGISDILCAAARELDELRVARLAACKQDIQKCQAYRANLVWRITNHDQRWDAFQAAYATVNEWRRPLFGANRKLAMTEQWTQFKDAARAYSEICPNRPEYRQWLAEYERKGLMALDSAEKGDPAW